MTVMLMVDGIAADVFETGDELIVITKIEQHTKWMCFS
jgi:hypothetical protein